MSRVTVTDLPAGTAVVAADVNATLSSWNAATAAGQIAETNVAVEGIDGRSVSNTTNVVEQNVKASDRFVTAVSTPIANATGSPVVILMNAGATPMQSQVAITASASANLMIHATIHAEADAIPAAALPRVWCCLLKSTDNGATWSTILNSGRKYEMRNCGTLSDPAGVNVIPGINHTFAWSMHVTTAGVSTLYAIGFESQNTTVNFDSGVLMHELLNL